MTIDANTSLSYHAPLNSLVAGDIILFREHRQSGHLYYTGADSDEKYKWNCVMLSCGIHRHDYEADFDYIDRIHKKRVPPYYYIDTSDKVLYIASTLYYSYFEESKGRLLGNCSNIRLIDSVIFNEGLIECLPTIYAFIDIYNNSPTKDMIMREGVEISR